MPFQSTPVGRLDLAILPPNPAACLHVGVWDKTWGKYANLHAMLSTLYDYWFVQFDFPDKNGKPYKSFGGKMVWNQKLKREIPDGWAVRPISELVEHINTGLNPRNNFVLGTGNIRYVTVKNLNENGAIDFSDCDTIDEDAQDKIHARSEIAVGDILFASIAPLGRCHLIQDPPADWDINESVFAIRVNKTITPEYLYLFLTSREFILKATHQSTGSIFKGIRMNVLNDTKVLIPCSHILDSFTKKASKLLQAKHAIEKENHELAHLRSWLLPMLMNGQATVDATQPNYRLPKHKLVIRTYCKPTSSYSAIP